MSNTTQIIIAVLLGLLLLPGALSSIADLSENKAINAQVRTYVNDGQSAFEEQDYELAEVAFTTALNLQPANKDARRGIDRIRATRVSTLTTTTSRTDAIRLRYRFEKALKSDPERAELYQIALGALSGALSDLKSAQAWYEKATRGKDASSSAWAARGAFDLGRGELDDASTALQAALKLDDTNARARLSYGIVLKEQKKYVEAAAELEKATASLRSAKAYYELGDTHLRSGKNKPAYSAFRLSAQAHGKADREPALLKRLGVTAFRLKKQRESIAYFAAAVKVDKDPKTRLDLGGAYQSVGEHASAIQQLSQVVKEIPLNAQARLSLMGSLAQVGQVEQAKKVGLDYLAITKEQPKFKKAAEMIQRALGQLSAPKKSAAPMVTVEEALKVRQPDLGKSQK
jgi:tetratricopeptide (TPR) repeat protein